MPSTRAVSAVARGDQVHLRLPGSGQEVVLSAAEAVDLLEQLRVLAPVLTEETARVSDRFGQQEDEPIERASRLPDDGYPRGSERPPPPAEG